VLSCCSLLVVSISFSRTASNSHCCLW